MAATIPLFLQYQDTDGSPLEGGYLYFGTAGQNPITNPITVYWDAALTQPASQPIRTANGYPARSGNIANIYSSVNYSLLVKNSNLDTVYSELTSADSLFGSQAAIFADFANTADVAKGSSLIGWLRAAASAVATTLYKWISWQDTNVFEFMTVAQIADVQSGAGTIDVSAAINAAITAVSTAQGGTLKFPPGVYLVSSTIVAQSYVEMRGAYGESGTYGVVDSRTGTKLKWGGANGGTLLDAYNVSLFRLDGFYFDANTRTGVTCILIDSDNNPSGSQIEFHRFSVREFLIGIQWGTSGLVGSYANAGVRISGFTIWSSETGSKGFVINSGNAGQDSVVESGGIQVDSIGVDIVVCNQIQFRRVFGGFDLRIAMFRVSTAIDILIEGCSSEGQGSRVDGLISNDSYFLLSVAPVAAYPIIQSVITMSQNRVNNPILLTSAVRINDLGSSFGTCYRITDDVIIPVTASANAGLSSVVAINNGAPIANPEAYGWQDSEFMNLNIIDPNRVWRSVAFDAGNFTGNGAMTWDLVAGDVETYVYKISGRDMIVSFKLNTTTVGGTPNTTLNIAIPAGKTSSVAMVNAIRLFDNGAAVAGFCYVSAGGQAITVQRLDAAAFTAAADVAVHGQITFEVD